MSIREKVEDLRLEFFDRYGVEVEVEIKHYGLNLNTKPETAERVAEMVAADFSVNIPELERGSENMPHLRWYNVKGDGCAFITFYNENGQKGA